MAGEYLDPKNWGAGPPYFPDGQLMAQTNHQAGGPGSVQNWWAGRPTWLGGTGEFARAIPPTAPPIFNTAYPTGEDVATSFKYDQSYGDPSAPYFTPGNASVREATPQSVKFWGNYGDELRTTSRATTQGDADRIHRQWLGAERSAVAKLGFKPGSMVETPNAGLTVGGLYDPKSDKSWYDTSNESSGIHESMHRGIQMLRREGRLPEGLPSDEMLVRALMTRVLGDVELGRGKAGDEQIRAARSRVSPKQLDAIEAAAAQYIANKRPMGPR